MHPPHLGHIVRGLIDQLRSNIRCQSIKDFEIRDLLGFLDNSGKVGNSTVHVVEISVHQGPVGGPIRHFGNGTGPNYGYYGPSAAATSRPHIKYATPCTEYKCSRASALSWALSPGIRAPITTQASFPSNPQRANNVFRSAGGIRAHAER